MSLIKNLKVKGSSLVSAMIFGFVVLVTVSGIVYIVKYNQLSIKSLAAQEAIMTAEQQYIQGIKDKGVIKLGKNRFGNYDFENALQSRQPVFSNKNVDVSLYNAEPAAITSDIIHKLIFRKNLKITKDIIFKNLPKHSMIDYHSQFVPINVPYVDIDRMSNVDRFYHLDKSNNITSSKVGYIGYIEKEYNWLLISVNGNSQVLNLRNLDLSADNYQVKIGWHLVKGNWQLLMAIYDKDHLYIYRTTLDSLLNNFDRAVFDLSNPIRIIDAPKNITRVSWYYLKDNVEPTLAVLVTRYDEDGNAIVVLEDIEYDPLTNSYKASIKDTINSLGEIKAKNIYVEALDPYYTLGKSTLYVFAGDRMFVYKADKDKAFKKDVLDLSHTLENKLIENKPIVVKKDDYSYYILVFAGDRYYQYTYTKDTDVINMAKPVIYAGEKIQNIIVKYGLKFVVTKNHVYIDDFDNQQLGDVSI